ncbi:hypothetical protein MO973_35120 [Paenibacillus sp. TRM 82003]|uniref:hypothetical protein n=1 Tax=Kineococcus sp. TRM81007 TaxID=2925831 RepID=UPI001F58AD0F|nr:hypothetical protein [Kineococcus sp. TRM81007]MCI2240627.1 hypothetical protein [Kineococcus sp. TRM81007]MCI3925451.1 hypothetical protein [Paenibacillus sp. TRM 82003]
MSGVPPVAAVHASGTAEDHWRDAWRSALRAVELDADAAEDLIERLHGEDDDVPEPEPRGDWIAPSLLGPVPAEFADRARALLQRQLDVSERLAEAMVQARSQRRGLAKLDRAERPPVFFDKAI